MKANINATTIIAITGLIIAWDEHQFGALIFLATLAMLLFWQDRGRQRRERANRSEKLTREKLRKNDRDA